MTYAMANSLNAAGEEIPVPDMEFLLFLANSTVQDNELTTPLDIENYVLDEEPASTTELNLEDIEEEQE